VALPYREASQSGIVAQAALFRRPVVATDVGGLAEAVGSRGILVPPADPAALAAGLVRALRVPPPPPALPEVDWDDWRRALLASAKRPALHLVELGEAS
jgi:glycosyltransferase involved in cell wall biosynthesis